MLDKIRFVNVALSPQGFPARSLLTNSWDYFVRIVSIRLCTGGICVWQQVLFMTVPGTWVNVARSDVTSGLIYRVSCPVLDFGSLYLGQCPAFRITGLRNCFEQLCNMCQIYWSTCCAELRPTRNVGAYYPRKSIQCFQNYWVVGFSSTGL